MLQKQSSSQDVFWGAAGTATGFGTIEITAILHSPRLNAHSTEIAGLMGTEAQHCLYILWALAVRQYALLQPPGWSTHLNHELLTRTWHIASIGRRAGIIVLCQQLISLDRQFFSTSLRQHFCELYATLFDSMALSHIALLLTGIAVALLMLAATGFVAHAQPLRGQFVGMVSQANQVVTNFSDSAWSSPMFHDVQNGLVAASSLGGVMSSFKASYGDNSDVHALAGYCDLENKRLRQLMFSNLLNARLPKMH